MEQADPDSPQPERHVQPEPAGQPPYRSMPEQGMRYFWFYLVSVIVAALMLLVSTDLKTFLIVAVVSVLFVVLVTVVVNGMLE
jgi:hypothetical protein